MGEDIAPSPQKSNSGTPDTASTQANAAERPKKKKRGKRRRNAGRVAGQPSADNSEKPKKNKQRHRNSKRRNSSNDNAGQQGNGAEAARNSERNRDGSQRKPSGQGRTSGNGRSSGKFSRQKATGHQWIGKTAYAALDLGTNNCRLLIARSVKDGFTVVDAFSRVVRLGEGLATTGKMSEEAMDRAVEALGVCAEKLKKRNVVLARSVATEACRQAENGREFIDRVAKETGIILDIIPPQEEARLAVLGCYALLEEGDGPALIFDIGGGSTELVLVGTEQEGIPEILDWVSVPWGVVSLTECSDYDQSTREKRIAGYEEMCAKVRDSFAEFASRLPDDGGHYRMMGTSGTVTTLSSVYLKLPSYDRSAVDGLYLATQDMRDIAQEIGARSMEERAEYPTIGLDRADLVVAGCAILEAIFDIWPGERLGVADRGIREGILRALMASDKKGRMTRHGR